MRRWLSRYPDLLWALILGGTAVLYAVEGSFWMGGGHAVLTVWALYDFWQDERR